jgi:DNA segregation ATPase FtsK/SpoIIIE-like protein
LPAVLIREVPPVSKPGTGRLVNAEHPAVSPVLKNNLGGRVCLRTTSGTQSRMMLDQNGAESLLGDGDLFFKTTGEPVRLQAPLLTERL